MLEKYIEKKLSEGVKKLGGRAIKFFSSSFTGMPDRIVILPGGRLTFVELKAPGKIPRPRQKFVIAWLTKLGFKVYVIDTIDKLNVLLLKYKNEIHTA